MNLGPFILIPSDDGGRTPLGASPGAWPTSHLIDGAGRAQAYTVVATLDDAEAAIEHAKTAGGGDVTLRAIQAQLALAAPALLEQLLYVWEHGHKWTGSMGPGAAEWGFKTRAALQFAGVKLSGEVPPPTQTREASMAALLRKMRAEMSAWSGSLGVIGSGFVTQIDEVLGDRRATTGSTPCGGDYTSAPRDDAGDEPGDGRAG